MKQTVNETMFRDAFRDADRKENFSCEGLGLLFEYLEEMEADTGEEIELDVIALCCDYSEDSAEDIAVNYGIDVRGLDEDEVTDAVRAYLEENTAVIGETSSGFVYAIF